MSAFRFGVAASAWMAASSLFAQAPPMVNFIVEGVTVEVGDGRQLPATDVVIESGKIGAIRPTGGGGSGTVVAGKGKYLYPGFFDGFSTRGLKSAAAQNGEARPGTSTEAASDFWIGYRRGITPEWKASDNLDLNPDAGFFKMGVTTAHLGSTRGSMRGGTVLVKLLPDAQGRVINPLFGESVSFRNPGGVGYPSNILGSVALIRQVFSDAASLKAGAIDRQASAKEPWFPALAALEPAVNQTIPVIWEAQTSREIQRAIALSEELGLKPIIYGGREAGKVAGLLKEKGIPVVLAADPGTEPPAKAEGSASPADQMPEEFRTERYNRWLDNAKSDQNLASSGVSFAFSSEGGFSSMLVNVRARISRGLPREAALRALTLGAAEIFGVKSDLGSIETGKAATLVLMSGPFEDPKSVVEAAWIDGRKVYQAPEAGK